MQCGELGSEYSGLVGKQRPKSHANADVRVLVNSITSDETYQLHPVHLVLFRRGELLVGGGALVDPCCRGQACPWRRD